MNTFYLGKRLSRFLSLILILIILCIWSPVPLGRAASLPDMSGRGSGYASVLYDGSNGLPTSEANAVVQSGEGFIWIGSYSGLIRYDGNEFYRYDSSTGVASVVSLYVDRKDRLWIGTNDSGVAMLRDEAFTFYGREEGLSSLSVHAITEDEAGNILIATTMGLAYIDHEDKLHVINDPQVNREYICELVNGEDGLIYGDTLSGAFFVLSDLRVSAFYSAEEIGCGVINAVCPDPNHPGYVFLGNQEDEICYGSLSDNLDSLRRISIAPHQTVNCIRVIGDQIWVCTDNGVGYLDRDYKYLPLTNLPMDNSIDKIMADYEGNLWFTSSRQGVMKIAENRFTDVFQLARLDSCVVNSTCRMGEDLYIGTDTGLIILDADYYPFENDLTELLSGIRIRCIKSDRTGKIWLCTYSQYGLVCYDPQTGEYSLFNTENGLASDRVRMLKELSDGTIAVATNAGVNLIRDGKIVATYDSRHGISNLEILCIEEMPDGRLLFGSDGDGIYVLEGNKVSRFGRDDGLLSEVILRIKQDSNEENLFWVITSNSIGYLRDGKITSIKNFPYSNNFDLYFDSLGRIWILSSNGIYVVLRGVLMNDEANMDYIFYDTECGMPHITTANSYSQLDEDGTLFVACSTGVTSVNINNTSASDSKVRLAVPFITVDDQYIGIHGETEIHIPADCRRLNIFPYAFTYSMNNPRISYYLEGFDKEPQEVNKRNLSEVSYTNLDGNTYRFHLSVINTLTGHEDQTLVVTLIKDKALHEQVWFWVLVAVAALALVAGTLVIIFRRKTAALLRKQEEHTKMIDEMTRVFANCIDMKDAYTNGHSFRVAKYTAMLAKKLGKSDEEIHQIYNIALLHDIGKISIPDSILNKPGRLTDEEFVVMKNHPARGNEILKDVTIAPELALGAGYHHERVDGRGYPSGLKGDEIPEVAQIIAVADTFDAMYSTRPYRKKMELSTVVDEIRRSAGTQLSEKVVNAFIQLVDEGAFDGE